MSFPKRFAAGFAAVLLAASGGLAACSSEGDTSGPSSGSDSNVSQENGSDMSDDGAVTKDEAGTIATDKYGGKVKEVESDDYNGKAAWEVEIRDSDEGRIEVKVAKSTGDIMNMEQDED